MYSFKLLAAASLIVGSLGLGGCISNADGSTPEDFAAQNNSAAAAAQENDNTAASGQANCPDEACQAVTVEKEALVANAPAAAAPVWVAVPEAK